MKNNIIGITGGIGCGKSKLVRMLCENYNCLALDTDSIAKELMMPGQMSYRLVVEYFGEDILKSDHTIDSKKLGAIVMSDASKLEILNRLTHPQVIKEVKRRAEDASADYDAVIIESALLLDTPLKNICNEIWNVSADEEVRLKRLCKFRGYTEERAKNVMKNQKSDKWYRENTTKTFMNNSDGGADMIEMMKISMLYYAQ